jgi:uncharacterized protein (DUF1778 family)
MSFTVTAAEASKNFGAYQDGAVREPVIVTKSVRPRLQFLVRIVRDLIDQAARVNGKTRSDLMIEAARHAAENALLDQTFVRVDAETYAQFLSVLDRPPSGEGYERLMHAPKP